MARKWSVIATALVSACTLFSPSITFAQMTELDAFSAACKEALNDVQEDRRACAIGVVESNTQIRVLFSNKSNLIFKVAEIYQSPPQQGQQSPIENMGNLKGKTVAIGGFENGTTIYSAKILSP